MFVLKVVSGGSFTLYDSNPMFRRFLGLPESYSYDTINIQELLSQRGVETLDDDCLRAIDAKAPIIIEQKFAGSDNLASVWNTLLVPMFGEDGEPLYVCGVARDVTILKEAEDATRESQQQSSIYDKALSRINESLEAKVFERTQELNRANSAKQRFLANISHEIRTPLTGIIGNTENLLTGELSSEDAREAASYIHSNSRYLLALMNDVLDISKIEAGKTEMEQGVVCLYSLFRDIMAIMAPQAKAKNLAIDLLFDNELPQKVVSDETRLKQILLNLISNAVKFTERGSITITASYSEDRLCVIVVDTGIGISQEQQENIFNAFSQSDNSITRRYGGTGLGLHLSQQFAELMNGGIQVNSMQGQGSVFRVEVIAESLNEGVLTAPPPLTPINSVQPPDALPMLSGRVLVAEDQPENNRLFCALLKRMGLSVTSVFNGKEAVNIIASSDTFDLILMDIQMPVMSGLDALQQIRAMGSTTPVVALTANVMSDDVARYKKAGFDDYISKPFELNHFTSVMASYLLPSLDAQASTPVVSEPMVSAEADLKGMLKERFPEYQDDIESAWRDYNFGVLKDKVHQLKGAALLFEFITVGNACRNLEQSLSQFPNGVIELNRLDGLVQELLKLLGEP